LEKHPAAYSTLKIEAACSSEAFVTIYKLHGITSQTTGIFTLAFKPLYIFIMGQDILFPPRRSDRFRDPSSLLYNGYRGGLSSAVKRPGREADHSPTSRGDVKGGGDIPPFAHASSWRFKWYLVFRLPDHNYVCISHLPRYTICPSNLSLHDLIILITFDVGYNLWHFSPTTFFDLLLP
jgi:hypothetical protein